MATVPHTTSLVNFLPVFCFWYLLCQAHVCAHAQKKIKKSGHKAAFPPVIMFHTAIPLVALQQMERKENHIVRHLEAGFSRRDYNQMEIVWQYVIIQFSCPSPPQKIRVSSSSYYYFSYWLHFNHILYENFHISIYIWHLLVFLPIFVICNLANCTASPFLWHTHTHKSVFPPVIEFHRHLIPVFSVAL